MHTNRYHICILCRGFIKWFNGIFPGLFCSIAQSRELQMKKIKTKPLAGRILNFLGIDVLNYGIGLNWEGESLCHMTAKKYSSFVFGDSSWVMYVWGWIPCPKQSPNTSEVIRSKLRRVQMFGWILGLDGVTAGCATVIRMMVRAIAKRRGGAKRQP